MLLEPTHRAWAESEETKHRTLPRSDISIAIQKTSTSLNYCYRVAPRPALCSDAQYKWDDRRRIFCGRGRLTMVWPYNGVSDISRR